MDIVKLRALVREWRLEAEEYKRLAGVAERRHDDEGPGTARSYWNMADVANEKADALEGILGVEGRHGEHP